MNQLSIKIDVDIEQLTSIVKQLSPQEKLKLNDAIWNENAPIPLEHQKLILERKAKAKKDPTRMLDWNKASKLLRS